MEKSISIGDLRERIAIQAVSESQDGIGAAVQLWSTVASAWAQVQPASNGEMWRRQQMQSAAGWTILVRYRSDLTPQMRIVWGTRVFQIRGLENFDMRKRFLKIAAEELSATVLQ